MTEMRGMTMYNVQRATYCGRYGQESARAQAEAEKRVTQARYEMAEDGGQLQLIYQCLDPVTFHGAPVHENPLELLTTSQNCSRSYTTDASSAISGSGSGSSSVAVDSSSLNSILTANGLANGIYNCSVLPDCNQQCPAPDRTKIGHASYNAGCHTEFLVTSWTVA